MTRQLIIIISQRLSRTRLSIDYNENQLATSETVTWGGRCQLIFHDEISAVGNTEGPIKYVRLDRKPT